METLAQGWEETPLVCMAVCGNPNAPWHRVGQRQMAGPLGDVSPQE